MQMIGDVQADIESDQVADTQGPHWMPVTDSIATSMSGAVATPSCSIRMASRPSVSRSLDSCQSFACGHCRQLTPLDGANQGEFDLDRCIGQHSLTSTRVVGTLATANPA